MTEERHHFLLLVKNKKWNQVEDFLTERHASEAADFFKELELPLQSFVFRLLPHKFSTKLFTYLSAKDQNNLLKKMSQPEVKRILADLNPDDRTELFSGLPPKISKKFLALLNSEDLRETKQLLDYPEHTVGRLMTPDFITLRPDWTVGESLKYVREKGAAAETVDVIYVVDENNHLLDDLRIKDLILADPEKTIKSISSPYFVKVMALDDREEALNLIKKYNLIALPVVDKKGILVGIITIDDLMDVGDEEATEDFHKLGALTAEKEGFKVTNVFEASVRLLYQARIIWLMLLVVMSIFSGAAMSLFQKVITEHITLVFFLPVLIGSGGNAGSQSSTLMVRALSLGDVKVGDWFKMIGKEFLVSGSLGLTMGLGITAIGLMRGGFEIASVVGLSMLLIVINGSVIGMSMPFLFTKFKKDPATASGPLVASITDICGVLIYFSIAQWYLNLF